MLSEFFSGFPKICFKDLLKQSNFFSSFARCCVCSVCVCVCVCMCMYVCVLVAQSCLTLCDPMDCVACQAPPSMEFSRQEYWSGLPFPSAGGLPNPGIESRSLSLQADSFPSEPPGKSQRCYELYLNKKIFCFFLYSLRGTRKKMMCCIEK